MDTNEDSAEGEQAPRPQPETETKASSASDALDLWYKTHIENSAHSQDVARLNRLNHHLREIKNLL